MEAAAANAADRIAIARIRYEHTLKALDRHATVLSELRGRASILLSAIGLTASLFGARALSSTAPGWINWIALAFVALGLLACLAVLAPVHDSGAARQWKVTLSVDELERATADASEAEALDAIVDALTPARQLNYRTLEQRTRAFNAAAVCLVLQVLAWSAALLAA